MLLNSNDESKIVSQAESIDYKNFFGQDYKTLTTSETKDIEKKLLAAKNISNKCKSTNDSKISYPGSNVIFDSIFYKSKKTGQYP